MATSFKNSNHGLKPTCYFRTVGKERKLFQWWTAWASREISTPPESCPLGEWREVPHFTPQAEATVIDDEL